MRFCFLQEMKKQSNLATPSNHGRMITENAAATISAPSENMHTTSSVNRQSLRNNKSDLIGTALFGGPKSESKKDGEASSGLHADIPHERTSEQFIAADEGEDNHHAV